MRAEPFHTWPVHSVPSFECLLPVITGILLTLILVGSTAQPSGATGLFDAAAIRALMAPLQRLIPAQAGEPSPESVQVPAYGPIGDGIQAPGAAHRPSIWPNAKNSARFLSGRELEAVYIALDGLREDEKFVDTADAIMKVAYLIQVEKMPRHFHGRTSFFTQGGFVIDEVAVTRVVEAPGSAVAVSNLAGILVHEYAHTQQYGAGRNPLMQSFYQMGSGLEFFASLPFEWSGTGFRDQNGQGHGWFEIGPWRLGLEAEQCVLDDLQGRNWFGQFRDSSLDIAKTPFGLQ